MSPTDDRLEALLKDSPDPDGARAGWESLREAGGTVADEDLEGLLLVFGSSPALRRKLLSHHPEPGRAVGAMRRMPALTVDECLDALGEAEADVDEALRRLRRHRDEAILRIGVCDLLGEATVDRTVRDLSALAEASTRYAVDCAVAATKLDLGDFPDDPVRFAVLGMGKLGGEELNFSSDVDLIYLFEGGEGESTGGRRSVSPAAWATRVAELVTRLLNEVTDEGLVFRVDLRLRPDGQNGPIVNSVTAALTYYESWGKTWERAAMLKARPIAGDGELGERFLQEMRPFVFRRYLDFETIEEIQAMKSRIDAAAGRALRRDVKIGPGGIREVEFVAQAHQLIHGGRDERLQVRRTTETLEALANAGILESETARELERAYWFLRDVEHKIQLEQERQTQRLPEDAARYRVLARRLGFRDEDGRPAEEAFSAELESRRKSVRAAFEELFRSDRDEEEAPEIADLVAGLDDVAATAARLSGIGFRFPEESARHLLRIREGGTTSRPSPRRERMLRLLAPALVRELRRASDPDGALANMAAFVAAVGARTSFLSLLVENPETLRLLIALFGTSPYLSRFFIRHPELLDSLVRADLARTVKDEAELATELDGLLGAAADEEARFDAIRRFRSEEFLRIGVNDINGAIDSTEVARELTKLADVCVRAALSLATDIVEERDGPLPGRFGVMGLGKLGGGELGYNSDLDVIFVYEPDADAGIHAPERFVRLAQRFLSILQVRTTEGRVYEVDARLRPSGSAGPLACTLDAFTRYYGESAHAWERQALLRARGVAGDPDLLRELERRIDELVLAPGLSDDDLAEIRRIRSRMEAELASEGGERLDLKVGPGGLVDVEFLVQVLQLRHGAQRPEIRARETREGIARLEEAGLLSSEDAATLIEALDAFQAIVGALRIQGEQSNDVFDPGSPTALAVCRRLPGDLHDPAEVAEAVRRLRERVREVWDRLTRPN